MSYFIGSNDGSTSRNLTTNRSKAALRASVLAYDACFLRANGVGTCPDLNPSCFHALEGVKATCEICLTLTLIPGFILRCVTNISAIVGLLQTFYFLALGL